MLLENLAKELDEYFKLNENGVDPAFSKFLPQAYNSIGFDWENYFEKKFLSIFNGLMIKGDSDVTKVYCASFLTDEILEKFISNAEKGDLLFAHHPINMECGDPRGEWGRGFVPLEVNLLNQIKDKGLSIYTCHAPLDIHKEISTNIAIAKSLQAEIIDYFEPYSGGYAGLICNINPINSEELIRKLKVIFNIPYVDFEGLKHNNITRIAIEAGCGDVVESMKEVEAKGVQAYITGEIHCHINNDYGHMKFKEMMEYVNTTHMSLIGVSHAASEFLVMKELMTEWFKERFKLETILLEEEHWWR